MPNFSRCWVTAAPNPTYKALQMNCKHGLAKPFTHRYRNAAGDGKEQQPDDERGCQ